MFRDWKQRISIDTRIAALIKRLNINVYPFIFSNNSLRVVIRVEGIHQNKRDIGVVSFVQVLQNTRHIITDKINSPFFKYALLRKLKLHIFITVIVTSICCTVRSRNVSPLRTAITDFGPWHPILVPKPPFNFITINLLRNAFTSSPFGIGKEL